MQNISITPKIKIREFTIAQYESKLLEFQALIHVASQELQTKKDEVSTEKVRFQEMKQQQDEVNNEYIQLSQLVSALKQEQRRVEDEGIQFITYMQQTHQEQRDQKAQFDLQKSELEEELNSLHMQKDKLLQICDDLEVRRIKTFAEVADLGAKIDEFNRENALYEKYKENALLHIHSLQEEIDSEKKVLAQTTLDFQTEREDLDIKKQDLSVLANRYQEFATLHDLPFTA